MGSELKAVRRWSWAADASGFVMWAIASTAAPNPRLRLRLRLGRGGRRRRDDAVAAQARRDDAVAAQARRDDAVAAQIRDPQYLWGLAAQPPAEVSLPGRRCLVGWDGVASRTDRLRAAHRESNPEESIRRTTNPTLQPVNLSVGSPGFDEVQIHPRSHMPFKSAGHR